MYVYVRICTYRSLSLCLLRALGSKNRDGDPDGASCLEDEAAHKHYQQQKQDMFVSYLAM
uniref:Uncharacterized protein n=1 Tax=Oryza glumipatula TaxID=40148 RepID=A0A0E0AIG8_9ORYZ